MPRISSSTILFPLQSFLSFLYTAPDELGADIHISTAVSKSIKSYPSVLALPKYSKPPPPGLATVFPLLPFYKVQPISHLTEFHVVSGESFRNIMRTPSTAPPHFSSLSSPCAIYPQLPL